MNVNYHLLLLLFVSLSACKNNPPGILAQSELQELSALPAPVVESSGLAFINSALWTHNDSGNATDLYQVSQDTETLNHTLKINDVHNNDWEDLAIDEQFLYIGNFGNNGGNRQDLSIYKVALNQVHTNQIHTDIVQKIDFKYQDQNKFDHEAYKHNFDCEAMIAYGDSLYLFSKNHADQECNLYRLSSSDSSSMASKIDRFDSRGTITAADYQVDSKVLALLGYKFIAGDDMPAFLWVFYDFEGADFFGGKSTYIDLKLNSQAEGVTFIDTSEVLISTEAESGGKGKLYQLDISGYLE